MYNIINLIKAIVYVLFNVRQNRHTVKESYQEIMDTYSEKFNDLEKKDQAVKAFEYFTNEYFTMLKFENVNYSKYIDLVIKLITDLVNILIDEEFYTTMLNSFEFISNSDELNNCEGEDVIAMINVDIMNDYIEEHQVFYLDCCYLSESAYFRHDVFNIIALMGRGYHDTEDARREYIALLFATALFTC